MHNIDSPMLNGAIRDFCHKTFYSSPIYLRAHRVKDNIVNFNKNKDAMKIIWHK